MVEFKPGVGFASIVSLNVVWLLVQSPMVAGSNGKLVESGTWGSASPMTLASLGAFRR